MLGEDMWLEYGGMQDDTIVSHSHVSKKDLKVFLFKSWGERKM